MCVCVKLLQSCTTFGDPMGCQAPLSMGFSRQEYWSGLPFPHPGDLPKPGIKPVSLAAPALQVDSLPLAPPKKPLCLMCYLAYILIKPFQTSPPNLVKTI